MEIVLHAVVVYTFGFLVYFHFVYRILMVDAICKRKRSEILRGLATPAESGRGSLDKKKRTFYFM